MIDAIHIGDYKTGTSWLQRYSFQQHPELVYVDWPPTYPEIAKLFYELVDARDLDFDANNLRSRFRAQIEKIDHTGKKLIVSREALCGDFITGEHARRTAERLFQVFGQTRILLVVREQFSMLASLYSQYVKVGGTLSLRDFVWDPLEARNLVSRLQYEKQIQVYVEIFGAENVSVRLFDELKSDKLRFLKDVFSFIGCQDVDFLPLESTLTNPSLTHIGATCQRVMNRFVRTHTNPSANVLPLDKLVALFLSSAQKESLLKSAMVQLPWASIQENPQPYLLYAINMALNLRLSEWCESIRLGKKIEIPADVRERFYAAFVPGNRILVSRYGLNLEKYGWTL
jgi:hypothetical protein